MNREKIAFQRSSTDGKHAPVTAISMKPATGLRVWQGSPANIYRNDAATDKIPKKNVPFARNEMKNTTVTSNGTFDFSKLKILK